jgi:hypothetical protein
LYNSDDESEIIPLPIKQALKTLQLYDNFTIYSNKQLMDLCSLKSDILQWKPNADSWSLLEVLHHLLLVEQAVLNYIEYKQSHIQPPAKTSLKTWLYGKLLNRALLSNRKFKAPIAAGSPSPVISADEIAEGFRIVREQTREKFETTQQKRLSGALFKHPLAGYLSPKHTAVFIKSHWIHHQKQINALIQGYEQEQEKN